MLGRFFNALGEIVGKTIFTKDPPTPATVANIDAQVDAGQTTPAAHGGIVIATIPLPGTVGADAVRGLLTLNVEVEMQSTTTPDAAYFKMTWAWSVQVSGAPVALGAAAVSSLAIGTNAGGPPPNWAAHIALDGGSVNALVSVDGDPALTVNVKTLSQFGYTD
jgi:hypothetical protein